jgi:hypothetical protein
MASDIDLIWVKREAEYFCKPVWTGQIRLIRFNNRRFSHQTVGRVARMKPKCRHQQDRTDADLFREPSRVGLDVNHRNGSAELKFRNKIEKKSSRRPALFRDLIFLGFVVERKMAVCGDAIQMRAMIQSRRERIQEQTNRQEWLL